MELFSEQDIADRFNDVFLIADYFCQTINESEGSSFEVDSSLLYIAVVATYDDIARYKEYHLADPQRQRSNAIKRAAYAAKWIMRFSPLISPRSAHLTGAMVQSDGLVNAMFAIHFALSNIEQFTGAQFDLAEDVYYNILYDLTYRNIGGEPLILVLEIICKALASQPLTVTSVEPI